MYLDPFWTATGLDSAVRNGISPSEVMDVLYGEPVIVWWDAFPPRFRCSVDFPGGALSF